jgi:hypothetical protein
MPKRPPLLVFFLGLSIPFGRLVASRLYFAIWVLSWAYPLRSAIWEALERPARPASVDIGTLLLLHVEVVAIMLLLVRSISLA